MRSILRSASLAAVLVGSTVGTAQAEISLREVRLDVASFTHIDGSSVLDLGGPTSMGSALVSGVTPPKFALGVYFNEKLAIEPQLGVFKLSPDGAGSITVVSAGAAVPYYFAGDYGKSGVFVAPAIQVMDADEISALVDFGLEAGYKKPINDNISWRIAAGLRTGDSTDDELAISASLGFSFSW